MVVKILAHLWFETVRSSSLMVVEELQARQAGGVDEVLNRAEGDPCAV